MFVDESKASPYVPPGLQTFELPPLSSDVHSGAKIRTKIQNSYWKYLPKYLMKQLYYIMIDCNLYIG